MHTLLLMLTLAAGHEHVVTLQNGLAVVEVWPESTYCSCSGATWHDSTPHCGLEKGNEKTVLNILGHGNDNVTFHCQADLDDWPLPGESHKKVERCVVVSESESPEKSKTNFHDVCLGGVLMLAFGLLGLQVKSVFMGQNGSK
jgi:hypothetical protein